MILLLQMYILSFLFPSFGCLFLYLLLNFGYMDAPYHDEKDIPLQLGRA